MLGATYGYSLLWMLAIAYALNFAIAEAAARYVLVTGKSIMEGYSRLGRPVIGLLALAIFARRHFNNLFMVLLLGTAADLLLPLPIGGSVTIWSVVSVAFAFGLMFRGGYFGVERFSRPALVVFGAAFIGLVALSHPEPRAAAAGLLMPSFGQRGDLSGTFLLLMALAGTAVGSINHLKYPTFVYEKGWRHVEDLGRQRADLAFSIFGQFAVSSMIQIAAAAVLFDQGVQVRSAEDWSAAFGARLGDVGRVVLGVGLWMTVLNTFIASNTGYSLMVTDVYERFRGKSVSLHDNRFRSIRRTRAYRVVLSLFVLPSTYVLLTSWEPFQIGTLQSALFLLLTPLLMAGLLWLTSDRTAMGDHANRLWSKVIILMAILLSAYLSYQGAAETIASLRNA